MSVHGVPRVGFGLELRPRRGAVKALAGWFERHLSKRFGSIRVYRGLFYPAPILAFSVNGCEVAVCIQRASRKKYDHDEWFISIDLTKYPIPKKLPKDEERKHAKDLMLISDEIHKLLTSIKGIWRLRWYFDGWDVKRPGVSTPGELPWD